MYEAQINDLKKEYAALKETDDTLRAKDMASKELEFKRLTSELAA